MATQHPVAPVSSGLPAFDQVEIVAWSSQPTDGSAVFGFDSRDIRSRPFNLLRSRILKRMDSQNWRSLGIVSASPGVGKTFISCNLAAAISRTPNRRVYLFDLDLRRSSVARNFGIAPSASLNQYLAGEVESLTSVACRPDGENLILVPSVPSGAPSAELVAQERMTGLLDTLRKTPEGTIVLCDLPPAFANDDASIIAEKLDAYLLIVEEGRTTKKQIRDTVNLLSPAVCAGTVLNRYHGGLIADDYGYGYGHEGSYGGYFS